MNKKILLLICMILSISLVLGLEFDNVKSYDEVNKEVTIKNSMLGIPTTEIAKVKLITPLINYVMPGKDRLVAEFEINLLENDYSNVLKNLEFYNKNKDKIYRDYVYKYKTKYEVFVQDYKTDCQELIDPINKSKYQKCITTESGTHKEDRFIWNDLINSNLVKGKISIGIFTDVENNDNIEWIPTIFSLRIDEWATWTASLNIKLDGYFKFDETTGSKFMNSITSYDLTLGNQHNSSGIINYAYGVTDKTYANHTNVKLGNGTINFWIAPGVKSDGYTILSYVAANEQGCFALYSTASGATLDYYIINSAGASVKTYGLTTASWSGWSMITLIMNTSNALMYRNGTLLSNYIINRTSDCVYNISFFGANDGSTKVGGWSFDEIGIWNRVLTPTEINDLYNNGLGIQFIATAIPYPNVTLIYPNKTNNFKTSSIELYFNCSATSPLNLTNISWNMIKDTGTTYASLKTPTGTNFSFISLQTSGVILSEGRYYFNCTSTDSINQTTVIGTYNITIDGTPPLVNITYPINNTYVYTDYANNLTTPLILNYTTSDNIDVSICSYNVDGGTYISVGCHENTTIINVTYEPHLIRFTANDSQGNFNMTSVYIIIDYKLRYNSLSYANISYETASPNFYLNVSYGDIYTSIITRLIYNSVSYLLNPILTISRTVVYNTSIDLSLINLSEVNYTFYFTVDLYNSTDTYQVNTTKSNQSVRNINLSECDGAVYKNISLNFDAYYEKNLTELNYFDFESTFFYWLGSGNIKKTQSVSHSQIQNISICTRPYNFNYRINANIEYGNESFTTRNYYFDNFTINNNTQNISLYLLETTDVTSFIILVQDVNLVPVSNAFVYIQKYYPSTNEYKTVQIVKTDDNGKSIGFYQTETVDYRHIIISSLGETLLITSKQKIFGEDIPYTLIFTIGNTIDYPWSELKDLPDLSYSLTYNNSNKLVTYGYIDSSSNFTNARLRIYRNNLTDNDNVVCNKTGTISSSFIYCDLTGNVSGMYTAYAYITRNNKEYVVSILTIDMNDTIATFGKYGLFLAVIIILIASTVLIYNMIAGIWVINLVIIILNIIGLINLGSLFIYSMIAISIILTILIRRST